MPRYEVIFEEVWTVSYHIDANNRDDLQAMIDKVELGESVDKEWIRTLPAKPDIQEI